MVSVPIVTMTRVSSTVREVVPEVADWASKTKVNPEETLNLLFKNLSVGAERKLENFNGERKISVFRGDGYMNKITQKLKEPCITFIRCMKNIGSKDNPKMATTALVLDVPNKVDALEIYFNEPGNSLAGVFINLYREGFTTTVQRFANLEALRKDPNLIRVIEGWTGKKLR